eukprot:2487009-Prymnesium_polylepis.2
MYVDEGTPSVSVEKAPASVSTNVDDSNVRLKEWHAVHGYTRCAASEERIRPVGRWASRDGHQRPLPVWRQGQTSRAVCRRAPVLGVARQALPDRVQ